jgi:hypothetical protein
MQQTLQTAYSERRVMGTGLLDATHKVRIAIRDLRNLKNQNITNRIMKQAASYRLMKAWEQRRVVQEQIRNINTTIELMYPMVLKERRAA